MNKKLTTIIFDLDGTLLNSLNDIHICVNYMLEKYNMPLRTLDEIRKFVGNGIERLLELAVPDGKANEYYEQIVVEYKEYYGAHCNDNTTPYPHIMEMLEAVKAQGYKTAITSNKNIEATVTLKKLHFPQLINVAKGAKASIRKKPAPDMVIEAMETLGSKPEECVFVGDSEVDIHTAKNAGIPCIAVSWGYRTEEELMAAGAEVIVETPLAIVDLLQGEADAV